MSHKSKQRFWNTWTEVKRATMTEEELRESITEELTIEFEARLVKKLKEEKDSWHKQAEQEIETKVKPFLKQQALEEVKKQLLDANAKLPALERKQPHEAQVILKDDTEYHIQFTSSYDTDHSWVFYASQNRENWICSIQKDMIKVIFAPKLKSLMKKIPSRKKTNE